MPRLDSVIVIVTKGGVVSEEKIKEVLSAIHDYSELNGFAPTMAELSEAVGISAQGVHYRLVHASGRGYVFRKPGPRAISITKRGLMLLERSAA